MSGFVILTLFTLYYRVSQKKVSLWFCIISLSPRGLEILSWTFFNSPFRVDSKDIHFVIIWGNVVQDIAKILQGSHYKSYIFIYYGIKNLHRQNQSTQKGELKIAQDGISRPLGSWEFCKTKVYIVLLNTLYKQNTHHWVVPLLGNN